MKFIICDQATASTGQRHTMCGFLVDAKGNIEYPRLGSFHAEGLTKDELAAQIKKRLTEPDTVTNRSRRHYPFSEFQNNRAG